MNRVSVIIPVFNEWAATQTCLDSVVAFTPEPREIIVVDNGSTDSTRKGLREYPVRVIKNTHNLGFPIAVNQGFTHASGEHIILLNNDTRVCPGWTERLVAVTHKDSKCGLVGPVGCNVSGSQDLGRHYETLYGLVLWQNWIARKFAGAYTPVDRLVGFCLLITRECFEKIGYLDKSFGIGCYDDNDYCLRARIAGFTLYVAQDVWIHHEGSRTFAAQHINYAALLERNRLKFEKKWRGRLEIPHG